MDRASILTWFVCGAMMGVVVTAGAMVSAAAAGENLAENPSAEQVDEAGKPVGWGDYQNTPKEWGATDKEFYTGNRSAFLRVTGFGDDDYAYAGVAVGRTDGYQGPNAIPVQPSTTYYFSFYLAGYGFKRKITVSPWGFKADGSGRDRSGLEGIKVLPEPAWTRYEGSFETKAETERVVLMFFVYGLRDRDMEEGATVYVDDVYLGTEEPPGPIVGTGRARVQVPSPPEEVKGEGYSPLEPGTVRIWDTGKKLTEKRKTLYHNDGGWYSRTHWILVPYGVTDYTFKGDALLEGANFWMYLHGSQYDSIFIIPKIDEEGTPASDNELYKSYSPPGTGLRNYGSGSQKARIVKNERGEIAVESEAYTYTRGGVENTVTTTYRILAGKPWVEIMPVRQATEQGMHGESRLIIVPEGGEEGNDFVADSIIFARQQPGDNPRLDFPAKSRMMLDLMMDDDRIYVVTWPDPEKARPYAILSKAGWHRGWDESFIEGMGKVRVWTSPFAYFGVGERQEGNGDKPVIIGNLWYGYWHFQKFDKEVQAGEEFTGQWKSARKRLGYGDYGKKVVAAGYPFMKGASWRPLYPGKWRITGLIDEKPYTQEVIVDKAGTANSAFRFTSPVSGTLEYLVIYLYDRTEDTPEDVYTPMDIYREAILRLKTGIGEREEAEERPGGVALFQNAPNPFNQWTEIRYVLPEARGVELGVWNLLGQKVAVLVEGAQNAGDHVVRWDGKDGSGRGVSSGMYFYRMKAGAFVSTKRMVILK